MKIKNKLGIGQVSVATHFYGSSVKCVDAYHAMHIVLM